MTIKQLSEVGALTYGDGYRTKRSEHGQPGYRILRVADVSDGGVTLDGEDHVHKEFQTNIGPKLSQPGDILLTTKGTVGRVAIYPPQAEQVVYSPQLCYFRIIDPEIVSPRYLSYWFKSEAFSRQALQRANSTDMAAYINLRDIGSLEIQLPSIIEQRAAADILGALDDKMLANEEAISNIRDLCEAHFFKALTIDPGKPCTLGKLADLQAITFSDGYRTNRSEHGTPGIRILRAGDVRGFRSFPDGTDYVSEEYMGRIGAKLSRAHDIVLTTKGTVGRVAVIPSNMETVVYSPQLCYFRVTDESLVNFGFMVGWFSSRNLKDQLSAVMNKTDMAPYVNLQDIRSLRVPIPDISVQRAVGSFQRSMLDFMHSLSEENDVLARTRDELLPFLMSGRFKVRDAKKIAEEVA
ncbi:restriction endonuclease subunit S [Paractinoplanes rhizophilus]